MSEVVPAVVGALSLRLPPSNQMAEPSLLGAILANNRAFFRVAPFLRPEHFSDPINGRIFSAMAERISVGRLADALTLKTEFENSGILDEVGGVSYLGQLLGALVGIINADEYGRVIHDTWVRRQLIDVGEQVVNNAFGAGDQPSRGAFDILSESVDAMLSLGDKAYVTASADLPSTLDDILAAAERAARGEKSPALLTGIPSLDRAWRGLWPGSMDILGARSEHGKTALGMQIAQNVAAGLLKDGAKGCVHIFSLEMPTRDVAIRMLAAETGISSDDIRCGTIDTAAASALVMARRRLGALPLKIEDTPGLRVSEITTRARVTAQRDHTVLIVIDHLHRISPERSMVGAPRVEQVQETSAKVKDLGRSLNVPILLLAQLGRHLERREDQRPVVADLQYASERDADNIALLWRPELHMSRATPERRPNEANDRFQDRHDIWQASLDRWGGRAEVIFAKRRLGPAGAVVELGFDGPRTRFFDLSEGGPTPGFDL